MKKNIAIYLAGSIKKSHENPNESFWSEEDISQLRSFLDTYQLSFLNPALRADDLSDQHSVFGRDMLQVFCSDLVLVDARDRRGLGVGAEMMWAKLHTIPLIVLAPKDSHYHKTQATVLGVSVHQWIHPFVQSLSDQLVETLQDAAIWIDHWIKNPSTEIKGIDWIFNAMNSYKEKALASDLPMQELIRSNPLLSKRMAEIG